MKHEMRLRRENKESRLSGWKERVCVCVSLDPAECVCALAELQLWHVRVCVCVSVGVRVRKLNGSLGQWGDVLSLSCHMSPTQVITVG